MSKTAEDLGRSTFFTAQQVAELQTNFGKLGFTTQEILNAQEATLQLATATDTDLDADAYPNTNTNTGTATSTEAYTNISA